MQTALDLALTRSESVYSDALTLAVKGRGGSPALDLAPATAYGAMEGYREQGANRARYAQYRNWLYSAIHALASEAAGQPVNVGRMKGAQPTPKKGPGVVKAYHLLKMPRHMRAKAAAQELELLPGDPLLDKLSQPNPLQQQWQFVYSFVANLALTGWGYIVMDQDDGEPIYYSLPTTWVTPDHSKGPFAEFKIHNPYNPVAEPKVIPGSNVAFAHFPNPSNPLSALAPASAQVESIRIDENIQACQAQFFENGVFPAVIVTMGKDPHPDVPGGVRPRLTGVQRRQVHAAIKRTMGGVANYGNPAIVDGMIESIERLSATQNEIGWEKSEQTVRTRILGAFGVHPFILGEVVAVGGYAQAAIIEERFCKRVNTLLDMLGGVTTKITTPAKPEKGGGKRVVWWDELKPHDPALDSANARFAVQQDIMSKNEYRAEFLGLPPDENESEMYISPRAAPVVAQILPLIASGQVTPDQAKAVFTALGVPEDVAAEIAGNGPSAAQAAANAQLQQANQGLQQQQKLLEAGQRLLLKYDPDQPRDAHGRWGAGGAPNSPAAAATHAAGEATAAASTASRAAAGRGIVPPAAREAHSAANEASYHKANGDYAAAAEAHTEAAGYHREAAGMHERWGQHEAAAAHRVAAEAHDEAAARHEAEVGTPVAYPKANPDGKDTQEQYKRADGTYMPERAALHNQMVGEVFQGLTPVAKPTAYMMGGGSAAGKSSILKSGDVKIPDNVAYIDSDRFKSGEPVKMPGMSKTGLPEYEPKNPAFVHEESSELASQALAHAAAGGYNRLLDGTGNNSIENLERKVAMMRKGGAEVEAHYVTVDTETAVARNAARDRSAPESFVWQVHANVSRILPEAVRRGTFDRMTLWDTNAGAPVKVASSVGKELTVHDQGLWDRFLAKGK